MLFDYLFVIALFIEWLSVLFIFLFKNNLISENQSATTKGKLIFNLLAASFGLAIFLKLFHVLLFIFQFNQKSINPTLLLPTTLYVLWQLVLSAIFFYLLIKFSFKNHFQNLFANALSKRIFAELIFVAVWDMVGGLLIYLVLTSRLWLTQLQPYAFSAPFKEPVGQILLLAVGLVLIVISILAFLKSKKEVTRVSLIFYSLSYLILILFNFFTLFTYRGLIFPNFENFFNQFYLFLAVEAWLIIFLMSVVFFSLMIQLYVNKKYLKTGFQFQFLFYNLSRVHMLSEAGMTLIVLVIVFFFIYF